MTTLCAKTLRNMDHFLVPCWLSKNIWNFFLSSFNSAWLVPNNVKKALRRDVIAEPLSLKTKWFTDCLPKAIVWVLWNERNRKVFEGKEKEVHNIRADIQGVLYAWSRGKIMFNGKWGSRLHCWMGWLGGGVYFVWRAIESVC